MRQGIYFIDVEFPAVVENLLEKYVASSELKLTKKKKRIGEDRLFYLGRLGRDVFFRNFNTTQFSP